MADSEALNSLRQLLQTQLVAALGTLHRGDPAVSMVPFVLPVGATRFFIHVSTLATHTADMHRHPRVSLLVMAELVQAASALSLPRVTLQAEALTLPRGDAEYVAARTAYLDRFPTAAETFELGDFSIVALQPVSARLVAGFGRAFSLVGESLEDWLRQ
jgi:heme iron utilization protein